MGSSEENKASVAQVQVCYDLKLELRLHLDKDLRGLREMI